MADVGVVVGQAVGEHVVEDAALQLEGHLTQQVLVQPEVLKLSELAHTWKKKNIEIQKLLVYSEACRWGFLPGIPVPSPPS